MKVSYEIHLHLLLNDTAGFAVFNDPVEAIHYFVELATDLLALPGVHDVDWIDDNHVHAIDASGRILAHATLQTETLH